MASRPIWKGQIRLSLVAIPVEIYSATNSSAKIAFRQIHGKTGKPVEYQKVVPGVGPVDNDAILKGFEYEKGNYVLLEPAEVDEIRLETKKTLELVQFVGACEIDPIYFDKAYFVVPSDELAEDAFRVVRDALRKTETIGLGQLTMRGKEYLVAVKPCATGLLMETLHYENEIRKTDRLFSEIGATKADPELLDVATELIKRKRAPFKASAFKDHFAEALKDLVDQKLGSRKSRRVETHAEERPSGENVIDLMSALKKSLEKTGSSTSRSKKKEPSGTATASRKRREKTTA